MSGTTLEVNVSTMILDVNKCARCGMTHSKLEFGRLSVPIADSDGTLWTCWAQCPSSGQPILMKVTDLELA